MPNSNNRISERPSCKGAIPSGGVPEDDLIVALSEEIEAISLEIEQQTLKREHLLQWRQMLLDEAADNEPGA